MIKKITSLCLSSLLLFPLFTYSVQASDTKLATVSIPVTTGLTGSGNSAKTFNLELPSGVSSTSIKSATLKYNGNNSLIGSISLENGKIKVTLKGTENKQTIANVQGFQGDFKTPFVTTPGNSIWLYSDGRRWQINDYKSATDTMASFDLSADDGKIPSDDPPLRQITTKSNLTTSGITWYNNSEKVIIDPGSIIQSTVKPLEFSDGNLYKRTPNIKGVYFKDNRIIIDYMIPGSSRGATDTTWRTESDDGKHDLSGHAEGRRYQITPYYYYTADANVTTYSYGGNISFDYALPDQATLNATATLTKPSPNPIKLDEDKVNVQISVKGELLAYADSSNIEEWVFYAKEKNKNDTLVMKKEYQKVLTSTKAFDFVIPAARVVNDNFKQDYSLTVVVRFKKPVVTKAGTITSLEQPLEISAGVYKKDNPVDFPTVPNPPTKPEGKPPIARISAPKYIKAGDNMMVYGGASSDPDGYITDYAWGTHGAQGGIDNTPRGYIWYTREQVGETFPIALTVVDNDGQIGSTSTEVTVIEPRPAAIIYISGTLKQNRKTTLINSSQSPTRFPLIKSKTQVTISAVSGGTNADIKYSGSLADFESKDVLFKKPGKYKATIYVENTAGYSSSSEITFDIVPDEAPFAYFSIPGKVYRDPSNWNKALVSIDDMSFSPDKDEVVRRIWEYRYDSNNNGIFTDEGWVLFNEENITRLNLELYQVGKYEIRLTVIEEFGQPTIETFVTEADRQRIDSGSTQNVIERIVEVNNRAPEVDWDL